MASTFRPFSNYMVDSVALAFRRLPQLITICLAGWLPMGASLWLLLSYGLHLPSVAELLTLIENGASAALDLLVLDASLAVQLSALCLATYILGQVFTSAAVVHQLFHASNGAPVSSLVSMKQSLARLHRTLPAFVTLTAIVSVPFIGGLGVLVWILWIDGSDWKEPVLLATGTFALVGILTMWLWGRLSLWPTAAVLAPRRTASVLVATRITNHHWWQVVLRLVMVNVFVFTTIGVLAAPLLALSVSVSSTMVVALVTARIGLSVIASGLAQAGPALVYSDATSALAR